MPVEQTFKLSSGTTSDMTNVVQDIKIETKTTDGSTDKETRWQNTDWPEYYGWYLLVPEVKQSVDVSTVWICGKQWRSPNAWDRVTLHNIRGIGRESFQQILQNMVRVKKIAGDSFAEIIRGPDDRIINLKPLDPGSMVIVANKKGIITRYEQVKGKETIKYEVDEILHFSNKRTGDSIHGESDLAALKKIIEANNESFVINKDVIKKFSRPMMKFMYDTDDVNLINANVAKMDQAVARGENLHLPQKSVEHEIIAIPPNATLNILPWRDALRNYFFQSCSVPQIVMGSANDFTESSAKISLISFSQQLAAEQLEIENALWIQMQIRIELDIPVTIQNEMLSDTSKDGANQDVGLQPAETSMGRPPTL